MCATISDIASTGDAIDYLVAHNFKASEAVEFVGLICKIAKRPGAVKLKVSATAPEPRQVKRPFPPDFVLTPELVKFATDRGFALQEVHRQWERFRDRNVSRGEQYVNWPAAWRTWVNNAIEFKSRDQRAQPGNTVDWRA
jgi:hypothetical protein